MTSIILPLQEGGLRFVPGFLGCVTGLQQLVGSVEIDLSKRKLVLDACKTCLCRTDLGLRIVDSRFRRQINSVALGDRLPNLGIDVFPDQMDFFQLLPDGPGRCIVRGAVYGLKDERREMRALRFLSWRINTQVNNEDRWLCSRVQRGLASSSYRPGPLSQLERWMLEFHELLRERIPEFRLASAPKQFA